MFSSSHEKGEESKKVYLRICIKFTMIKNTTDSLVRMFSCRMLFVHRGIIRINKIVNKSDKIMKKKRKYYITQAHKVNEIYSNVDKPMCSQTFPEDNLSIWTDCCNPTMCDPLVFGSYGNISIKAKSKKKITQQDSVVFTILKET